MKNVWLFLFFSLQVIWCVAQNRGDKSFMDQPYIEVTGTAEMEVVPDEIHLKIVISEKDSKGKQSLAEIEKGMFIELRKLDVDISHDLSIRDVASNLKSYWLKGSVAQTIKEYILILHDTKKLGDIFRKLNELGISDLSIDKVGHSKLEELNLEVKVQAVKAAKRKAEAFAAAAGRRFGNVIYINDVQDGFGVQNRVSNVMLKNVASDGKMNPEVEFEKIRLKAVIVACFGFWKL